MNCVNVRCLVRTVLARSRKTTPTPEIFSPLGYCSLDPKVNNPSVQLDRRVRCLLRRSGVLVLSSSWKQYPLRRSFPDFGLYITVPVPYGTVRYGTVPYYTVLYCVGTVLYHTVGKIRALNHSKEKKERNMVTTPVKKRATRSMHQGL